MIVREGQNSRLEFHEVIYGATWVPANFDFPEEHRSFVSDEQPLVGSSKRFAASEKKIACLGSESISRSAPSSCFKMAQ
jgi:hypothetical protein